MLHIIHHLFIECLLGDKHYSGIEERGVSYDYNRLVSSFKL